MIVQIFGIMDLIAAGFLYFGKIPGPSFIVGACILLLIIKGIMSIYPVPFYLPGVLMNLTDAASVILLYFGTTPFPGLKSTVIAVLLIKSLPSLVSSAFILIGWASKNR